MALTDSNLHAPPSSGTYTYSGGSSPGTFMPDNTAQGFPVEGGTYVDPVFGETIRRISDGYNTNQRGFQYSSKSMISANGTYCILANGQGQLFLYNMTGGLVRELTNMTPTVENWQTHPTVDNWACFMTDSQYKVINVDTDAIVAAETITFGAGLLNGGESNFMSSDGKNIVGLVDTTLRWYNKDYAGFYSDQPTDVVTGQGGMIMLPSGNGCIASGVPTNYYSVNHTTHAWNSPILLVNSFSHCSATTDTEGTDWFVCAGSGLSSIHGVAHDFGYGAGNYPGTIFMDVTQPDNYAITWFLYLGEEIGWLDTHYGGNVRATSSNADWVCISSFEPDNAMSDTTPWTPWTEVFQQEVFIVNVRTQALRRLCHHRSRDCGNGQGDYYYSLPFAGLSYDGTLAHFNSDMGRSLMVEGGTIRYVDAYTVTTGLGEGEASASPSGSPVTDVYKIGAKVNRQNPRKIHPKF